MDREELTYSKFCFCREGRKLVLTHEIGDSSREILFTFQACTFSSQKVSKVMLISISLIKSGLGTVCSLNIQLTC